MRPRRWGALGCALALGMGAAPAPAPQAGVVETLRVEVSNEGTVPWSDQVKLAYHWLDGRNNPIVWDGPRSDVPSASMQPAGRCARAGGKQLRALGEAAREAPRTARVSEGVPEA